LIVEDFEAAARRNFADRGRMEAVVIVAVAALHEYATVAETFGKHFASDVIQMHPCQQYHQYRQ